MKIIMMMLIFVGVIAFFLSCDSLPFGYSGAQSWYLGGSNNDENQRPRVNIKLSGVSVDRPGGWDSIEKEFESLAPLYFWNHGCRLVNDIELADYTADISAREREYISGWRTQRSLAVEVRIWDLTDKDTPLAVGRVVSIGSKSFSSSETVGRMLSKAISKSVKGLNNG